MDPNAPFWSTLKSSLPWNITPSYSRLPGFDLEMIVGDLLHVWNLGVAQSMGGSILKELLQSHIIFDGNSLETRMEQATQSLRTYAKTERLPLRMKKITKKRLRWKAKSYPELACSGYDTYVICKWLQNLLQPYADQFQDYATLLWSGNHAISLLYSNTGWWLQPAERRTVSVVGSVFLQTYTRLAYESMTAGRLLFRTRPKMHILDHIFKSQRSINHARYSTWMDEDFLKRLGKTLKLTSSLTAQQRILERYMFSLPENFKKHMQA